MKKLLLSLCFPVLMLPTYNANAANSPGDMKAAAAVVTNEPVVGSIQEAMKEFNSLSRKEKKSRFKEMKSVIKTYKADKKAGKEVSTDALLQALVALFIPPLGVYLHEGETNNRFWISVLLTILGLVIFGFAGVLFLGTIPSIVYALIVILGS